MTDSAIEPSTHAASPSTVEVTRRVHVWDDPASKIAYMESLCKGKDWETSIYARPGAGDTERDNLRQLSHALEKRGFICQFKRDEENHLDRLDVHHIGTDNGLIANIRELGFVDGTKHTMTHLSGSLGALLHEGRRGYDYVTSDKARLLSGFYLLGDIAYKFSSHGENYAASSLEHELLEHAGALHPHSGPHLAKSIHKAEINSVFEDNKNLFSLPAKQKNLSGEFGIIQSLIYLYYARDTGEVAVGRFQKDVEKAFRHGQDPLDPDNWKAPKESHLPGPLKAINKFLHDKPIEAGAYTQMAGQALMTAGGITRMMNARSGLGHHPAAMRQATEIGALEAGRGLASITAWELLKQDPRHSHHEHAHWYDPRHWLDAVLEKPQQASSIINTGASLIGLAAAGHSNNWIQRTAEVNYLMGDATMFMLKKAHYGGGGEVALELGADAATKLICDSNIVFGWKEEGDFVKRLSNYIGRRIVEETTVEKGFPTHQAYLDEVDRKSIEIAPKLGLAITQRLANRGRRLGTIAHSAALIVNEFSPEQQPALIDAMAQALSKTKAVYASPEEFRLVIRGEVAKIDEVDGPAPKGPQTLTKLTEKLSDLLLTLPGYDVGSAASRLYDAIRPHCLTQHVDAGILQKNLRETAKRGDDVPPAHQLQLAAEATKASEVARI